MAEQQNNFSTSLFNLAKQRQAALQNERNRQMQMDAQRAATINSMSGFDASDMAPEFRKMFEEEMNNVQNYIAGTGAYEGAEYDPARFRMEVQKLRTLYQNFKAHNLQTKDARANLLEDATTEGAVKLGSTNGMDLMSNNGMTDYDNAVAGHENFFEPARDSRGRLMYDANGNPLGYELDAEGNRTSETATSIFEMEKYANPENFRGNITEQPIATLYDLSVGAHDVIKQQQTILGPNGQPLPLSQVSDNYFNSVIKNRDFLDSAIRDINRSMGGTLEITDEMIDAFHAGEEVMDANGANVTDILQDYVGLARLEWRKLTAYASQGGGGGESPFSGTSFNSPTTINLPLASGDPDSPLSGDELENILAGVYSEEGDADNAFEIENVGYNINEIEVTSPTHGNYSITGILSPAQGGNIGTQQFVMIPGTVVHIELPSGQTKPVDQATAEEIAKADAGAAGYSYFDKPDNEMVNITRTGSNGVYQYGEDADPRAAEIWRNLELAGINESDFIRNQNENIDKLEVKIMQRRAEEEANRVVRNQGNGSGQPNPQITSVEPTDTDIETVANMFPNATPDDFWDKAETAATFGYLVPGSSTYEGELEAAIRQYGYPPEGSVHRAVAEAIHTPFEGAYVSPEEAAAAEEEAAAAEDETVVEDEAAAEGEGEAAAEGAEGEDEAAAEDSGDRRTFWQRLFGGGGERMTREERREAKDLEEAQSKGYDSVEEMIEKEAEFEKKLQDKEEGERLQAEARDKINRVVEKTGLNEDAARELLSGNDGNVKDAIKAHKSAQRTAADEAAFKKEVDLVVKETEYSREQAEDAVEKHGAKKAIKLFNKAKARGLKIKTNENNETVIDTENDDTIIVEEIPQDEAIEETETVVSSVPEEVAEAVETVVEAASGGANAEAVVAMSLETAINNAVAGTAPEGSTLLDEDINLAEHIESIFPAFNIREHLILVDDDDNVLLYNTAEETQTAIDNGEGTPFAEWMLEEIGGETTDDDGEPIAGMLRNFDEANQEYLDDDAEATLHWCAIWVGHLLKTAGDQDALDEVLANSGLFTNPDFKDDKVNYTRANMYRNVGTHVYGSGGGGTYEDIQVGDIVILKRNQSGTKQHVGIYVGDDEGGNPLIMGGNQGDRVMVEDYTKDKIIEVRRANVDLLSDEQTEFISLWIRAEIKGETLDEDGDRPAIVTEAVNPTYTPPQ